VGISGWLPSNLCGAPIAEGLLEVSDHDCMRLEASDHVCMRLEASDHVCMWLGASDLVCMWLPWPGPRRRT